MRRIIGGAFLSLDGVMQAPGGPREDESGGFKLGGWTVPHFDEAVGGFMGEMMGGSYDLLLGRRTYDIFAAHWPRVKDDSFADTFNRIAKYVLTHDHAPLGWNNAQALADIDAVATLRSGDGPDLIIQGSGTLYPPLLERALIDRLFLITFPVVLGSGKRLFDDGGVGGAGAWRLVEQRTSLSGVVMAVYEPAGAVRTGSFALPDDGDAQ